MDYETALSIMQRYIGHLNEKSEFVLRETNHQERMEEGWVFYFNSAEYLDTGRFETQLVGQGPVIVLADGSIVTGGSAERPKDALKRHGILSPAQDTGLE